MPPAPTPELLRELGEVECRGGNSKMAPASEASHLPTAEMSCRNQVSLPAQETEKPEQTGSFEKGPKLMFSGDTCSPLLLLGICFQNPLQIRFLAVFLSAWPPGFGSAFKSLKGL